MNIDFRKLLTRSAPAITSFVFLVVAWNRVWNNTAPPWASDDDELEQLRAFYPDRYEDALESRNAFKFSAFEYPSRVVYGYYIAFVILILTSCCLNAHLIKRWPASLQSIRTQILESPLVSLRHNVPIPLFGLRNLTVQAPLRYQAAIVAGIICLNIIPLVQSYRIVPGDRDVFWPDPHSHRDQLLRYLADRSATLTMAQLPLVILMSGKNSPIALISGLDMNDLMLYHRWCARMVWLQMNVHGFCYILIGFLKSHLANNFKKAYWNWGVVAFAMMWGLTILSIREIRRRHYEVFVFLHIAMCIVALVGLYLHIHLLHHHKLDIFERATIASAAFWAFDRVIRLLNRFYHSLRARREGWAARASITVLTKEVILLRISVPASHIVLPTESPAELEPSTPARISAGQSIGLTVPCLQWMGDHPFTVMATGIDAETGVGHLDLAIKANQGLTKKIANVLHVRLEELDPADGVTGDQGVSVLIDGPYGKIHDQVYDSDNVLLFAGGVGVTFVLPHFVRIALHAPKTTCKLVWMVRDLDACVIIEEQLQVVMEELEHRRLGQQTRAPLLIEIHVTSAQTATSVDPEVRPLLRISHDQPEQKSWTEDTDSKARPGLSSHWFDVTIKHGRASMIVEQHFPASDLSTEQTLTIMSCGPAALCDEARRQAKLTSTERCWKVVEYVEECYSW